MNARGVKVIGVVVLMALAVPVLMVSFGLLRSSGADHAAVSNGQDSVNEPLAPGGTDFDASPSSGEPADGFPVDGSSGTLADIADTNRKGGEANSVIGPDVIQSDTFPETDPLAGAIRVSLPDDVDRTPGNAITQPLQRLAESLAAQPASAEAADGNDETHRGRSGTGTDDKVVQVSGTSAESGAGGTADSVNPLDLLAVSKDDRRPGSRRRLEAASGDTTGGDATSEPRSVSVVRPEAKVMLEKRLTQPLAEFLQAEAVPLRQIIGVVGELAAVRIDTATLSVAQLDTPVTLHLKDTTPSAVLQTVLARIEAGFEVLDGQIRIIPQPSAQ